MPPSDHIIYNCLICSNSANKTELRGVFSKGKAAGLYCQPCFELGKPGMAFLQWKNALPLAAYIQRVFGKSA